MDTKEVKQLAIDVNNVAAASFQSGKKHIEKPLLAKIEKLEVACRLAKHELRKITNDSYALAAIEQALKEGNG